MNWSMMRVSYLLLLCVVICCASGCKEKPFFRDAGPLVATNSGKVVGKYVKVFDTDVAAFLGIPFAKPPLGDKRFSKPEPIESWTGLMLAHDKPPPCMQYSNFNNSWTPVTKPSEDCLYLNIWTPTKCCCGSNEKMPVLVWIHGGAFSVGSTDMDIYDGSVIASYGEAIVVSMNYRLGMFGFLNAGSSDAPGNAGLYDQQLALMWIKDNIHNFGGDTNRITLFGESAGSMSISMHMISPKSRGLFNRAIMQSGTMFNPQFYDTPQVAAYKTSSFAKMANCGSDTTPMEEIVTCFRSKDATELAKLENTLTAKALMYFLPSTGNDFMPKSPVESYVSGDIAQVDVLMGVVRDEGTIFFPIMMPEVFRFDQKTKLNVSQAETVARSLFHLVPEPMVDQVIRYYFQNATQEGTDMFSVVARAFGDFFFNCPQMFLAEKLDNAYVYWMTHQSLRDNVLSWLGVHHFYDVAYVFGQPILDSKHFTPEDGRFSGELIQKWVNFARQGYPLSDETGGQTWRRFTPKDPVAYELNPRTSQLIPFPRREACNEIWRPLIVPKISTRKI